MQKRERATVLGALLMLIGAPAHARTSLVFEEGIARNPGSAAELYREQHWTRRDGERPVERIVLYRCPDGTAFARKRIDYRASATAPAFAFEDTRSGYAEGLRRGVLPLLYHRPDHGSGERTAPLDSPSLVADAGFDEFIRRHWLPLSQGKELPLRFAVPSRLRSMGFNVVRAGQSVVAGEAAWVFRLKLDGMLGWVAPSIDVSYGKQSRRLLRFEGLGNLRDDAGKQPVTARIDFAEPARPASESQWAAAGSAPLSGCRAGR